MHKINKKITGAGQVICCKMGIALNCFTTYSHVKKNYSFHKKCKTQQNQCAAELRKYTHILSTSC